MADALRVEAARIAPARFLPYFLAILFCIFALGRIPLRVVLGSVFIFAIILAGALIFYNVVLGSFAFSTRGLFLGFKLGLRILCAASVSLAFIWTTRIKDFTDAFVKYGVPYRLAYLVFITLRFVPIISEEYSKIKDAHQVRGFPQMNNRITNLVNRLISYFLSLSILSLRRADILSMAMECRGYGAYGTRTPLEEFRWSKSGLALLASFIILEILLLIIFPTPFTLTVPI